MQEEPKSIKVNVKWGTQKFDNLVFELTSPLEKFRMALQDLTSVPQDKQKIIFKGQTLKDETNLLTLKIADGAQIMMMGQVEEKLVQLKANQTKFIEDLTPEERAKILKEKAGIILPVGLTNLGNTCYLNASIQCLKRVNEFKKLLTEASQPTNVQAQPQAKHLYRGLSKLMVQLEQKGESFKPSEFVNVFMNTFPMFAQMEKGGGFKQQDADECFQNVLQVIEPLCVYETKEGKQSNLVKDLFEVQMEVTFKNSEIPDEPETKSYESNKKFMCIIDNEFNPVNTLAEGIKVSLEGNLIKKSSVDNLDHVYTKTSRIKKLPSYLLVQMVRFIWKQGQNGKEGNKAKILRQVSFPKILDLFEFCSDELKQNLTPGRELEKKQIIDNVQITQDKFEAYKKSLEAKGEMIPDDTREIYKRFKEQQKDEELKQHDEQLYREHGFGLETGNYQIIGVLTHKGRDADSGHYVAWIHHSGDAWVCYDDDKVSEVKTEQILDLRGGGDWHMGYYLLYRKLEIQ